VNKGLLSKYRSEERGGSKDVATKGLVKRRAVKVFCPEVIRPLHNPTSTRSLQDIELPSQNGITLCFTRILSAIDWRIFYTCSHLQSSLNHGYRLFGPPRNTTKTS
jgi:hypothetical protein